MKSLVSAFFLISAGMVLPSESSTLKIEFDVVSNQLSFDELWFHSTSDETRPLVEGSSEFNELFSILHPLHPVLGQIGRMEILIDESRPIGRHAVCASGFLCSFMPFWDVAMANPERIETVDGHQWFIDFESGHMRYSWDSEPYMIYRAPDGRGVYFAIAARGAFGIANVVRTELNAVPAPYPIGLSVSALAVLGLAGQRRRRIATAPPDRVSFPACPENRARCRAQAMIAPPPGRASAARPSAGDQPAISRGNPGA